MLSEISNIAKEVLGEYVDVNQIGVDTGFDSLDIDSLLLVELAVMLNKRLGFIVTEFEIKQGNSIRSIAELYDRTRHLPFSHGDTQPV
ncbi:acyl carrier protein [Paraburkholderia xenovorans]|uniref:acyl carrier protein n=1 Tax=Paraburkholderia xenovorans TaxID=36873 RepID=UPI0038B72167